MSLPPFLFLARVFDQLVAMSLHEEEAGAANLLPEGTIQQCLKLTPLAWKLRLYLPE